MPPKGYKKSTTASAIEIEQLKAQLAKLERMLLTASEESEVAEPQIEESGPRKIQLDDTIRVMSLIPFPLNLSTKEGGQGSTKKFTKFGEVKKIIYKDLVDILEVHRNFVEMGYFYILDQEVIRQHGLTEEYSKILTREKIEEILTTNSNDCVDLYTSANPGQQEIIVQLLVDRMITNPDSVNLNVIDKISRLSKTDISSRAADARELEEEKNK